MAFPWLFPFLFVVAIALCAAFMFRGGWWGSHQHGPDEREDSALDILDRRFARGEIDRATYDEMRQALRH